MQTRPNAFIVTATVAPWRFERNGISFFLERLTPTLLLLFFVWNELKTSRGIFLGVPKLSDAELLLPPRRWSFSYSSTSRQRFISSYTTETRPQLRRVVFLSVHSSIWYCRTSVKPVCFVFFLHNLVLGSSHLSYEDETRFLREICSVRCVFSNR